MIEFCVLGPLSARAGDRELDVGSGKQRSLLALLLLSPGQTVSTGSIIDALWDVSSPASAEHAIEVYASRLRKQLRGARQDDLLSRRGSGYLLAVARTSVDAGRFEQLLEAGQTEAAAGQREQAASTLRRALELWRGRALEDVELNGLARAESSRLEELRLHALEERIDSDLALSRHGVLVPELRRLVADDPLRERFRAQLMLALYRSGRQAEALEEYRRTREVLVDGLGIYPGPELRSLEQAILRQSSDLDVPTARHRHVPWLRSLPD